MINWWSTSFGEEEIDRIARSIRNQNVSQGKVTAQFERALGEYLNVEYVVATSSGSAALMLALIALGIRPGDEVIVPNRTWIATAHAAYLLGAKVVLADVESDRPVIDVDVIQQLITKRTKAIIPVHMNGRAADMPALHKISKRFGIAIVEDAAQAIGSRNSAGFLGTQSDIGCFSLSVAKTIATGQGGFAVTNSSELAKKLRSIRTHGVENVTDPKTWGMPGFNFRFTDIQASIGIEQLKKLPERVDKLRAIYARYLEGLADTPFIHIPVDINAGEVPVYNEFLAPCREQTIDTMRNRGIEIRPFYPDLSMASYLQQGSRSFPNSRRYGDSGIYLPSGPSQSFEDIDEVIHQISDLDLKGK